MYNLFHADCLGFLSSIADSSIDHINCDPPYNTGNYLWDQTIDDDAYLVWCRQWLSQCARILKPNRMMCIWGSQKTDLFFRLKLEVLNHLDGMVGQPAIHWSYNWGGRTKSNFAHKFETAWCYSKGDSFLFNADDVRIERKMPINIRTGLPYEHGTIPTTVWEGNLATVSLEAKESRFHETVKPQFVLQRMIRAYTNPGDTVLDCFSGSGSTLIAAAKTGRVFFGCEKDEDFVKKSIERAKGHDIDVQSLAIQMDS